MPTRRGFNDNCGNDEDADDGAEDYVKGDFHDASKGAADADLSADDATDGEWSGFVGNS